VRGALVLLSAIAVAALLVPLLSPWPYDIIDWDSVRAPPFTHGHLLGTDGAGRDLLARCFVGARVSIGVGLAAAAVSLVIGVLWGATAGMAGGRIDDVMMRIVDVLYALPFMFFVIVLMVVFGRSILLVFLAIGAVEWLTMARIVRGQTIALKERGFVLAAEAAASSRARIIRRHILPNLAGVVLVYLTLTVPQVMLVESFLSFLGLGVQEPLTSLGMLIKEGADEMEAAPWALIAPGAILVAMLAAFNLLGERLRARLER
jgi:oligopeptide transport system permease protein